MEFNIKQNEKHMIEERKKLEEDIRAGRIFSNPQPASIGRGTAMTLPAWMTEVVITFYLLILELYE